jgi:hypothetical protein
LAHHSFRDGAFEYRVFVEFVEDGGYSLPRDVWCNAEGLDLSSGPAPTAQLDLGRPPRPRVGDTGVVYQASIGQTFYRRIDVGFG